MGSPFRMTPGKGSTARTTGSGFASRGLVNPSPQAPFHTHEGGKKHAPKSESLSKKSPSYTEYSTEVKNTPGTSTTTKTNSTGGSKSTSNYDDAQKKKKDLGPDFKPTAAQTAKANSEAKALKNKDKANAESNSASSSSKTTITKPSRTKKDFTEQINSYQISASDQQKAMENKNKTNASRNAMRKEEVANLAAKDSANVADKYRLETSKGSARGMNDAGITTGAVLRGNAAGRKRLERSGTHTKEEQNIMFNPNYAKSKVTAGPEGYKSNSSNKKTRKQYAMKGGETRGVGVVNPELVPGSKKDLAGKVVKGKKGYKTYGPKDSNPGTRGSRGE